MRRAMVLTLWFLVFVFYFVWNHYHPAMRIEGGYVYIADESLYLSYSTLPIPILFVYLLHWVHMVNEWDRRPILRFGRYAKTIGPGLCFVEPLIYTPLPDVHVQDAAVSVVSSAIQTQDNVGVDLDGLITYRIHAERVRDAVVEVDHCSEAVLQRARSTLTDVVGQMDLDHLLGGREAFCKRIKDLLSERVKEWGVSIKAFELKGFKIADPEIEKAIAMKARAKKEGEAEVSRAEYQKQVAAVLSEAAAIYSENGYWLKELEVLIELCRSAQNNTVLIPSSLVGSLSKLVRVEK